MQPNDPSPDEEWEDIVRRLGGTQDQAQTEPVPESPPRTNHESATLPQAGPRDYTVADELIENFQPPQPKPIASGNPRTVLSWTGVIAPVTIWILAALLGLQLARWVSWVTILAFLAGAVSLFFLLPKSWAHRDPFDDDDFGDGAKV